MFSPANLQDARFIGDKGFGEASTALLSRLVLEYGAIIADPVTPATLLSYARVVLCELREEFARRAPSMEAA
jgi:hypothetical protein